MLRSSRILKSMVTRHHAVLWKPCRPGEMFKLDQLSMNTRKKQVEDFLNEYDEVPSDLPEKCDVPEAASSIVWGRLAWRGGLRS